MLAARLSTAAVLMLLCLRPVTYMPHAHRALLYYAAVRDAVTSRIYGVRRAPVRGVRVRRCQHGFSSRRLRLLYMSRRHGGQNAGAAMKAVEHSSRRLAGSAWRGGAGDRKTDLLAPVLCA